MSEQQIWFGTRAVKFTGAVSGGGAQLDLLDDASDFATRAVSGGTSDFTGSEWQQVLAFVGTEAQQSALGVDLSNGVDVPTAGAVDTSGDLRVGSGVVAHNLADSGGGTRLSNVSGLDRSDDPLRISGHGKLNNATVTDAETRVSDGWVTFSNDKGFGFVNGSGAEFVTTATRLNDGDSVTFDMATGKVLKYASFTVKVVGDASAFVVLDSDGMTIRDTNAGAANGFEQDASAGETNLGAIVHGSKVEIDFDLSKLFVNGVEVASGGFFAEALANGGDILTLGSVVGNAVGWSADDLVLTTDDEGPDVTPGAGRLSLDLFLTLDGDPAIGGLTDRHLYAYLDTDEDNTMDAAEAVDVERFGRLQEGHEALDDASGDGDDNPVQGSPVATDWLDLYALGMANVQVASGHQYGEHIATNWTSDPGRFALVVNSARDSADVTPGGPSGSPSDIETGDDTYDDEPPVYVDTGEILGFVLKTYDAASATIAYGDATDLTPSSDVDIIVRLYQGSTLIEEIEHDITGSSGSFTVADNFGAGFDRMEIQAAGGMDGIEVVDAGARFILTDLDFALFGSA